MISKGLLAAAIIAALNPAPTAGQGMIALLQTASVHSSTAGAEHLTNPLAATGIYPVAQLYPSAVPPRPHYVAGYTNHALERMAQRGITKAQVEALVASPDPGYYQDDNDTWLITDGHLIVIINKNAWIVTRIKGQM